MKKLKIYLQRLPAKKQVLLHLLTILVLLSLIYVFLGCPAFTAKEAFRRAEKAAMVGPATVIGQLQPPGYDCDAIVLGQDQESVYLFVMNRLNPAASQMVYRKKDGNVTVLAAPGDTLYQYEVRARIPLFLFDSCPDALRAEMDLTLGVDSFEKIYRLSAARESAGYFYFDLSTQNPGSLGPEGAALRLLQEICSNSMAGNPDVSFPVTIRFYGDAGNLIREETTAIRSVAAQVRNEN